MMEPDFIDEEQIPLLQRENNYDDVYNDLSNYINHLVMYQFWTMSNSMWGPRKMLFFVILFINPPIHHDISMSAK